ncbi:MAG: kelch repeat-containing protein [Bryobacteraceae bacterium]
MKPNMLRTAFRAFPLIMLVSLAGHSGLAQSAGTFSATGSMTTARTWHTATLLANGKVLITGGELGSNALITAELYDPDSGVFAPTGDMTAPRFWHTATLLPDGKVLVAGGSASSNAFIPMNSAEIYDPSTGTFAVTGNMIFGHVCQQANLLGNGKVLILGGSGANGQVPYAELYDPATGTFAAAGTYASDTSGFNTCQGAVSTLLPDGRVLIVWEEDAAELYDPDAGTFTPTGKPIAQSYNDGLPTATLLMNGQVLVAGGADDGDLGGTSAELYDSGAGTFTATGNMITGHVLDTATLLPDGTVLIAGSFLYPGALANAELYSPATGTFTTTGNMITARGGGYQATLLNGGQVLVTGGFAPYPAITSSAEIYHPLALVPAPVLFSLPGDGRGQGAIWHATTGQVPSASNPAITGEALAMYTTSLAEGGVIPPQVAIGGRLAEILFFGDAPGYPGFNQVNIRVPCGIAPGSDVPVRLTYLGRSSNEVTIAVQ